MKVKITQPGIRQNGTLLEVGDVHEIEGDEMPPSFVNKAEPLDGNAKVTKKKAVTNPKSNPINPDSDTAANSDRQARFEELSQFVNEDDRIASGAPDVNALNALLDEGEEPFTAAERDSLYTASQKD